jgi:DNA-directed RNA polymerase subunit M/transcription elongation factor TFIIS
MDLPTKRFKKVDESFICENCGYEVPASLEGSCRNHCPKCLYSKHLDINPGDRLSKCGGLMKPFDIEKKNGVFRILHKCIKCGYERWNKCSSEDDIVSFYEKQK